MAIIYGFFYFVIYRHNGKLTGARFLASVQCYVVQFLFTV